MSKRSSGPSTGAPGEGANTPRFHGQDHAYERLYRRYWQDLCERLRRVFGNGPPEPEDLAQSAFIRIARLDNLSAIENPRAYLFRVAHNLGLNAIKSQQRTRSFVDRELSSLDQPMMQDFSAEDVYHMKERVARLSTALDRLSDVQREIVVRVRIYGETYAEISASTGWSEAKISRQLHAALKTLQELQRAFRKEDKE